MIPAQNVPDTGRCRPLCGVLRIVAEASMRADGPGLLVWRDSAELSFESRDRHDIILFTATVGTKTTWHRQWCCEDVLALNQERVGGSATMRTHRAL